MATKDFTFLSDDLRRQTEIAEEALQQARKIDATLKNLPANADPQLVNELEESKKNFLRVAQQLAANTSVTSASAKELIIESSRHR